MLYVSKRIVIETTSFTVVIGCRDGEMQNCVATFRAIGLKTFHASVLAYLEQWLYCIGVM